MKSLKKLLPLLLLPLFAFTAVHKYYVSVTHVNYSEKDKAIQITTRLFIDDFDRLLMARYDLDAELATEKESPLADAYIEKYLRTKFLVSIDDRPVEYDFIGKRYDNDVMVCYIEIPEIDLSAIKTVEIENAMLTDLFEEQQNLVHINLKNKKKSFVLVKSRAKGMLNL
ncbi:DUF6702 family protein [Pseudozobellia thermophila]|uniref:Peptidase E n=1 Tax=Pseudozobellia thermophila TaxID=192903 RepID=A0A1M6JUN1_9FLAO|nr:DUF6702 family protein [Pseudozobellia thermophila]SHJ50393.1 hypothetical protein SAMN04488513_105157 [Pseudozobellia thermophila]